MSPDTSYVLRARTALDPYYVDTALVQGSIRIGVEVIQQLDHALTIFYVPFFLRACVLGRFFLSKCSFDSASRVYILSMEERRHVSSV